MSAAKLVEASAGTRRALIVSKLSEMFARLFGSGAQEAPTDVPLIELGVDSLFLLQTSQVIKSEFGVKIPFRLLLEELSTIEAVAEHLDQRLPADFGQTAPPAPAPAAAPAAQAAAPPPPAESRETPAESRETPAPARAEIVRASGEPTRAQAAREPVAEFAPARFAAPDGDEVDGAAVELGGSPATALQHIVAQQLRISEDQLRLMSLQLELLRGDASHQPAADFQDARPAPEPAAPPLPPPAADGDGSGASAPSPASAAPAPASARAAASPAARPQAEPETFVPHKPLSRTAGALDERQRRHLDALIARLNARTGESKRLTERYRPRLANKRASAGYRQLWKELIYPLNIRRGQGSRVWDVDGHEYVDLTMGFGALLFGHSPDFIVRAVQEQLKEGIQIGAHTPLTGEVAELICELTGVERVAFCNSGTEAVMASLRLARAVTGRSRVALFEGCYHGTFDGIMVRGEAGPGGRLCALPMAPGVPQKMVEDVLLLKYNSPESLALLREQAHELAAVLIEPPRSRRPDVQPQEFLRELRAITEEAGAALIFDEVVTGFRFHPGGAQAMFGIKADLVTYGKAVGGGMPVAVVAGKAAFMDAVDGGAWNYGDASFPEADITFMTGTYFQHPVIMAALRAALRHIREQGPALQERLAEKTTRIAEALNAFFDRRGAPLRVVYMGSLFRLLHPADIRDIDLIYYHLLEKGVFISETRNCLLSTAHTDEDVEHVIRAFQESTDEMIEGGFLPVSPAGRPTGGGDDAGKAPPAPSHAPGPALRAVPSPAAPAAPAAAGPGAPARLPLTAGQKQIWALANMDDEGGRAYNQSFALHLRGPLDAAALTDSLRRVVARHEALRATFSPDGDYQEIAPAVELDIPAFDLADLRDGRREARLAALLEEVGRESFDLARGPLLRARLLRLAADHHLLAVTMHHIVSDGWSMGIILRELEEFYAAAREGRAPSLPPADSFAEYAAAEAADPSELEAAGQYWLGRLAGPLPVLNLPTDRPRSAVQTYAGAQRHMALDDALHPALKRLSAARGCTLFMTLLAGFKVLLHHLTDQEDVIVGTPAAGQLAAERLNLVGYCVNLLPLRSRVADEMSFAEYLDSLKNVLAGAYDHQQYPYGKLLKQLNLPRAPGRSPLVEAVFNVDRGGSSRKFFDLEMEVRPNHNSSSKFDLTMDVTEGDGRLALDCEYNTALFSDETARQWMEHYEAVMRAAASDPHARLADVREALREDERRGRSDRHRQLQHTQLKRFQTAKRRALRAS
ncbi:MAG TPA: aminotransferase class III-fold pyridoxal phosphate-dependent enzyme [Pyrinomonadaceae bacterium]|jgi:glutamate-1-semialdehyde-2,1-aminomutase